MEMRPNAQEESERRRVIAVVPAIDLVRRWREEFRIDVARCFAGVDAVRVMECEDSGLIYFDPPVIGDEALYQALATHDWYYLEDKWEHRFSLRAVRPAMRVLEVGCGRGAFLAKVKGLGATAVGMELNGAAAAVAAARGVDIVQHDIDAAPAEWRNSFDLVTTFQVVEHVRQPYDFCRTLFSFVKPGGVLHVAVPNHDSFMRYSATLLDLPPHHATRWNARSLFFVGERLGARNTRVIKGPLEAIHVDPFLDASRKRFGRLVVNRISRPVLRALLNAGGRHLVDGHSIVGVYRR
jgi:2-polyprenyl-3-methyl-5-hydroxy-6-metoxy-1,4-benzoquinol methylase